MKMDGRGLAPFVHLRERGRRPGPADYAPQLPRGPSVSILGRHGASTAAAGVASSSLVAAAAGGFTAKACGSGVFPGPSDVPGAINPNRAVRLPPHASENKHSDTKNPTTFDAAALKTAKGGPEILAPPQHSMALCPDGPSFSFGARHAEHAGAGMWVLGSTPAAVGPASYDAAAAYATTQKSASARGFGSPPQETSVRPALPHSGPASCALRGFGDPYHLSDAIETDNKEGDKGSSHVGSRRIIAGGGSRVGKGERKVVNDGGIDVGDNDDGSAPRQFRPHVSLAKSKGALGGRSQRWVAASATITVSNGVDAGSDGITTSTATPTSVRRAAPSTFGLRSRGGPSDPFRTTTADKTPGPAAYETSAATRILSRHATRPAPRFMRSRFPPLEELTGADSATTALHSSFKRKIIKSDGSTSKHHSREGLLGPRTWHPPVASEFDFDFRKGFSLLGRWHDPRRERAPLHRFDVEEDERFNMPREHGPRAILGKPAGPMATRIAAEDAQARARIRAEEEATPGPGHYTPKLEVAEPRSRHALVAVAPDPPCGPPGPGPGHYVVRDEALRPNPAATIFHRSGGWSGDASRNDGGHEARAGSGIATGGTDSGATAVDKLKWWRGEKSIASAPGPATYFRDEAAHSPSIRTDATTGKRGCTFGIRYPARATHQVAPPLDATTNTNCCFADEL